MEVFTRYFGNHTVFGAPLEGLHPVTVRVWHSSGQVRARRILEWRQASARFLLRGRFVEEFVARVQGQRAYFGQLHH